MTKIRIKDAAKSSPTSIEKHANNHDCMVA